MRTYELRIYTLRTGEALQAYSETIYPRHRASMPRFGVEPHGFWTQPDDPQPRLFALVSYGEGANPKEVTERYLASPDLAADVQGFDTSNIVGVETTLLIPSSGSPLR